MQNMTKCKTNEISFTFKIVITYILEYHGVNLILRRQPP